MKTLAIIDGLCSGLLRPDGSKGGVPRDLVNRLCEVYPEGRRGKSGHCFCSSLSDEDRRTAAILQILERAGVRPWGGRGKKADDEYMFSLRRIYDDADLETCELLELVPTESVEGSHYRDGPGAGPILIDRPLRSPISFAHIQTWVLVRNDFKSVLESSGLRGIVFEPTKLRFDPSEVGLTETEATCWEVRSSIELPAVSSSMTLVHNDHTPFTGDFTRGCHRKEGFYLHPELHYRREDMEYCEPFDLALTYEVFQGGSVPSNYNKPLVASKRFYAICKQHNVETGWVPVRIDE